MQYPFITYRFFFLIIASLLPIMLSAQDVQVVVNDSVAKVENIKLSDISRKSAELELMAKELDREMIDDASIAAFRRDNDSIIALYDSLLIVSNVNVSTLSTRNLKGKLVYWQLNLKDIKQQESKLISVFEDLHDGRTALEKESARWKKIDMSIIGEQMAMSIQNRIIEIEKIIDTTLVKLDKKSSIILSLLDKFTQTEVRIESFIKEIQGEISIKQEGLLLSEQPSFLNLEYSNIDKWRLSESMKQYYAGNLRYLVDYLQKYSGRMIIHILFILALIYLFRVIGKTRIHGGAEEGGVYKKRLKIILSKPISAALIVALFANIIIYPYRPLLFLDISRFILTIPIVIILVGVLPRRFHLYVYLFGLAVFLHIIYLNLPIDKIESRIILLVISLLQFGPLVHFLFIYQRKLKHRGDSSKMMITIAYFLLVLSIIGLVANLFGKVVLSVMMVEAVLGFILATILIVLSLIVVNGLLVLFIDGPYSKNLNIIQKNKTLAKIKLTKFFNLFALLLLIFFMLKALYLDTYIINGISDFLYKERNIGLVEFTWGIVLLFFFVIWLSTVIGKFLQNVLEEDVLNRVKLEKGLPHTIALMVKYSLVTLGVFLAVSAAGLPMDSLTVILGAFGVGIGFGLQNIFNNLVSGLILLFERPIKIEDTIEVGTLMGNVKSIGIRASNVRTFDGAEIIVPNGNLISNEVINWTLSDQRRRIEVIVGVSYSSDPHKVHEVLLKVMKEHKDVVDNPEPNVYFRDLGESSLDFRMLFWTHNFDQWVRIRSEIIFNVFDELKAAGIEIPFPQRDLHVRSIEQGIEIKNVKT